MRNPLSLGKLWSLVLTLGLGVGVLACQKNVASADPEPGPGLLIEDVEVGMGETAVAGKTVFVHYTGRLIDGKKFDSSYDHDGQKPIDFVLGRGMVIPGWDQGLVGMKVGGKRKLTIPPALAYGNNGSGSVIPPKATLIFDVELMAVK